VQVVAPAATVATGATAQFTVIVQNASNPAVNWEVDSVPGGNLNVGTIDPTGFYTAPLNVPSSPLITVSAVLAANAAESGSATITVTQAPTTPFGVYSWRNDSMLSGGNNQEIALTPATVAGGKFGELFSCPVDGAVYAQPLYVANLSIPGVGLHNVVFVATENDSVYAFDADANPCQTLWQTTFLINGAVPVPSAETGSSEIAPEIGITGTPVIDPSTNTLYVVSATQEPPVTTPVYVYRLHALDITTGNEKFGGPMTIAATVPGDGDGSICNGSCSIPFVPLQQSQSAGLMLSSGRVYVLFGGYGNADPFHGWIFAYNAASLAQTAVFNTTPNGSRGGIWQGGAPPSVDSNGNIFVAAGNGKFDANSLTAPNTDYAQTVLRLTTSAGLAVADSFTPSAQIVLSSDIPPLDVGASGVLLLPAQAGSAAHPNLAIVVGQQGTLCLVDRSNLGGYRKGANGGDNVVQTLNFTAGTSTTPAYWVTNNSVSVYLAGAGDNLRAFQATGGVLSSSAVSSATFGAPGASPVISSNGSSYGIVWALDASGAATGNPAVLHAYDATNLTSELYDSSVKSGDAAGPAVEFAVPTVARGKVYLGTQTELTVYGLAP
jgi:hypothetical protein